METPEVAQFRTCIVDGRWAIAEKALTTLGVTEEEGLLVGNESFHLTIHSLTSVVLGRKIFD